MFINPIKYNGIKNFTPAFKAQKEESCIKNADVVSDVFIKQKNSDLALQRLYFKFNSLLDNVTARDIEKIISDHPDIPRDNMLFAMYKLSGFSNIASIVKLKDKLEQNNFLRIHNFYAMSENRVCKVKNPDSGETKYVQFIPHNLLVPLGAVLGYLYNELCPGSAKCPLKKGTETAFVLDSNCLKYLKEVKNNDPDTFDIYKNNYIPVYIENFENTYNIFEQHRDFASDSANLARKITKLKQKYPSKTKDEIANIILNSKILKEIRDLGIEPLIIKQEQGSEINPDSIAKRLSFGNPSIADFEYGIDYCLAMRGYERDENAKKFLLNYLDDNTFIYSPKSLSKKLMNLHKMIEEDVKAHGRSVDKIYYNVLNTGKSYGLINYMFQKANNIPEDKLIYWDRILKNSSDSLKKILPQDSTIVVLDDNIISGSAILSRDFEYANLDFKQECLEYLKDYDIVFASVLAYDKAINKQENLCAKYKRKNKDRMISVDKAIAPGKEEKYMEILNPRKNTLASSAIMFPYSAPDNNIPFLFNLFSLYYPQESFLKESLGEKDYQIS